MEEATLLREMVAWTRAALHPLASGPEHVPWHGYFTGWISLWDYGLIAPLLNPGCLEGTRQWSIYCSHWEIMSPTDSTVRVHPCPPSVGQPQLRQGWEELLGSLHSPAPGFIFATCECLAVSLFLPHPVLVLLPKNICLAHLGSLETFLGRSIPQVWFR